MMIDCLLRLPNIKTEYTRKSFCFMGAKVYDELPIALSKTSIMALGLIFSSYIWLVGKLERSLYLLSELIYRINTSAMEVAVINVCPPVKYTYNYTYIQCITRI